MNYLESRIRDELRGREGDAPAFDVADARQIAGRTRRRQILNASVAGIGALAVVVALTTGFGGLLRADPIPADPPAAPVVSGALAYSLDGDIYVAEPDGTNAVRITDVAALDDDCPGDLINQLLSWSPDGRYLAFRGPQDPGCSSPTGVVITDPQGTVVATFPGREQVNLMAPAWSPDSTRVAVWDEYRRTIGVYGIDGTRQTQIAMQPDRLPYDLGYLSWTPDGTSLIVDQLELPLDGGTPREHPIAWTLAPRVVTYSPDGSRVAYATRRALMVARSDWSEPRRVLGGPYTYAWSPTGELIAVTAPGDPYPPNELHVVDVATGSVTQVFEGGRRTSLWVIGFSPEGDRILFTGPPGGMWSVGVDGSDAHVIEGAGDGAWRPV